jgi:hypothetical protein
MTDTSPLPASPSPLCAAGPGPADPSDLGEVRHAPAPRGTAPRRVVAAPKYAQYEGAAPPCDAPPATAERGPLHRTTQERTPPPRGRLGVDDLVIEDLSAEPWPAPTPGICICTISVG